MNQLLTALLTRLRPPALQHACACKELPGRFIGRAGPEWSAPGPVVPHLRVCTCLQPWHAVEQLVSVTHRVVRADHRFAMLFRELSMPSEKQESASITHVFEGVTNLHLGAWDAVSFSVVFVTACTICCGGDAAADVCRQQRSRAPGPRLGIGM